MSLVETATAATPSHARTRVSRVVLVDGQRLFREGLRVLLASASEDGFCVVGEAAHSSEVLGLVDAAQPDAVITELHLPDGSALPLIEAIHARFPNVVILVLTAVRARDAAIAVRRAGALGYLLKECGRSELLSALRSVVAGHSYRSRPPSARTRMRDESSGASNRLADLTERQRLVLRAVARGQPARQIAASLGVSVRAVHRQRERLRNTLQLDSTAALARFALREGLAE